MVMRLLISLWLTVVTTAVWAQQPLFSVSVDKHELVLGTALVVSIRTQGASAPLDSLNLDALKPDFDVYTHSSSKQTDVIKGKTITSESATIILYPLHSGQLQLPAFQFDGKSSQPIAIKVLESGPDTPPVSFKTTLTPANPITRQVATLNLDIYDDGSLQWSSPKLATPAGTYIRELAPSQWETTVNGTVLTVHRLAWAVMPLNTGKMSINFPMLNAVKFGNRLRYAAPAFQFESSSAPRYLPVNVPIGKLSLSAQLPQTQLILNRPANWQLIVRGSGISVEGLAKLLPTMIDSDTLHFYPPQLRLADESDKSLEQIILVTLPFQPLQAGAIKLPEIALPYYNPATGEVESATLPPSPLTVINPLWRTAAVWGAVLLTFGSLAWTTYYGNKFYRRRRTRLASLQRIATATDPQQLIHALLAFDWGYGAIPARTLRTWQAALALQTRNHTGLSQLIHNLEIVCYQASPVALQWQALRTTAWQLMQDAKPVRNS